VQDISERKEAERRQKLLVDELNHRVKNTLATVQSLAAQTARNCRSAEEFRARFEPRLLALSAAHDRLTRNQWEGACLGEIAREELAAHTAPGRRLRAEGPDVHLPPRASLSLSMALHELATNAAKYGGLSCAEGGLSIHWTLQGDDVDLRWTESGGPTIESPPTFEGFGTQLSQRSITGQLGGTLDREWRPEGLRVHMILPVSRLSA